MKCSVRLVIALGLVSCGSVDPGPLVPAPSEEGSEGQLPLGRFEELAENQQRAVKMLHDEATRLAKDPKFRSHLEQIDALLARPGSMPISGRRFARLYFGLEPQYQALPVCYRVRSGGVIETASTSFDSQGSKCGARDQTVAVVTLRSATLERMSSQTREARACAVNTLTHEWAHAIAFKGPERLEMLFIDEGHHRQPNAVASYVVGAFAQCLYLQEAYGNGSYDVWGCVEAVGTNTFDPLSCVESWGAQFAKKT